MNFIESNYKSKYSNPSNHKTFDILHKKHIILSKLQTSK